MVQMEKEVPEEQAKVKNATLKTWKCKRINEDVHHNDLYTDFKIIH